MSETGPTPATEDDPPAVPETDERTSAEPTTEPPPPSRRGEDPLRGSRTSGLWTSVVALVVLLILLAVFVFQNTQEVQVTYFGWEVQAPLAAALLIATAAGGLIVVAAGSLRILQLRRRVRRERKR
jgi:uncharacterized integral membrane protein